MGVILLLDKKGYSLIEIIICIGIIGILSTGAVALIGFLNYANTKKCAEELNVALEKARMDTIAKSGTPYFYIYKRNDKYYYKLSEDTTLDPNGGFLFGNHKIDITYQIKGCVGTKQVTESAPLKLAFLKSTGGFTNTGGAVVCEDIFISGSKDYKIHLVEKTGKHYIE